MGVWYNCVLDAAYLLVGGGGGVRCTPKTFGCHVRDSDCYFYVMSLATIHVFIKCLIFGTLGLGCLLD